MKLSTGKNVKCWMAMRILLTKISSLVIVMSTAPKKTERRIRIVVSSNACYLYARLLLLTWLLIVQVKRGSGENCKYHMTLPFHGWSLAPTLASIYSTFETQHNSTLLSAHPPPQYASPYWSRQTNIRQAWSWSRMLPKGVTRPKNHACAWQRIPQCP